MRHQIIQADSLLDIHPNDYFYFNAISCSRFYWSEPQYLHKVPYLQTVCSTDLSIEERYELHVVGPWDLNVWTVSDKATWDNNQIILRHTRTHWIYLGSIQWRLSWYTVLFLLSLNGLCIANKQSICMRLVMTVWIFSNDGCSWQDIYNGDVVCATSTQNNRRLTKRKKWNQKLLPCDRP